MMLLASAIAAILIGLIMAGIAVPRLRRQQGPPGERFRLHITGSEPDDEGFNGWRWEVLDTSRIPGSDLVVWGIALTWADALSQGIYQRNCAEQEWAWRQQKR